MVTRKLYTLVFVRKDAEVLLGLKKRGFGEGKWNGFGGKVEPGESIKEGAIRELKEECGLYTENLRSIGVLEFQMDDDPFIMEVHVFETFNFHGNVTESEEMRPEWFKVSEIPRNKMWPDDVYWWPYMLRGELFKGSFIYQGMDTIVHMTLNTVEKLS